LSPALENGPVVPVRVIETAARIAPFGDPVGDIPIAGMSFSELQRKQAQDAGVDDRLTVAAHAIATAKLLRAFVANAPRGTPSALAVRADSPLALLTPVSSIRREDGLLVYDVFLDAPYSDVASARAAAKPVVVEHRSLTYRREFPRVGPGPHHLDLPADGVLCAHLEHWVHLLWVAPLLVPALGPKIDPTAQVHPSAHVEGSIIGPGAIVGAGSRIHGSYIGANARLADFSKVTRCMLGDGVHTLADATFSHVVSLGEGTLTNLLLRDVVVGRKVFLTSGVIFWGEALGESITVDRDGVEVDTGRPFVGGCVGHGSVLGARTIVGPGRALPNRTLVVLRREEGVMRVEPTAPGTPLCWDNAALVPFDTMRPGQIPAELDRALHEDVE